MSSLCLFAIFLLFSGGPQQAHKQSDAIDEDDLRNYLAKQNECEYDQIYFSMLEQVDFLNRGYKQAVVVASTCMTGTAGPDIHPSGGGWIKPATGEAGGPARAR